MSANYILHPSVFKITPPDKNWLRGRWISDFHNVKNILVVLNLKQE